MIERNETRVIVDLDSLKEKAEAIHKDVAQKVTRHSVYHLFIRQTKVIRLAYLKGYLLGKTSWDSHVLECMSKSLNYTYTLLMSITNRLIDFFDHCLRQFPSEQWVTIKRNFYDPLFPRGTLAGDLVVNQGVYCAPRLSEVSARLLG